MLYTNIMMYVKHISIEKRLSSLLAPKLAASEEIPPQRVWGPLTNDRSEGQRKKLFSRAEQ